MSVCVIFNPAAGRRRAKRRLERFRQTHGQTATFRPTEYSGHAVELARQAAEEGFTTIVAAGGDGTAHDVANGILISGCDTIFAVAPIGSANDYAHSVEHQFGKHNVNDDVSHTVDVGLLRANGRECFFIECLGLGLAGQVTIESRGIPYLQGVPLYGLAAWRALQKAATPPHAELIWDGTKRETVPLLMLSLLLGRREGSFLLAPDAILDDGLFDYGHVGRLGRWEAMRFLPRLAIAGPPKHHPEVRLGRCHRVEVNAAIGLAAHVDGEVFCTPEENVRDFAIELLPKRLKVKVCSLR